MLISSTDRVLQDHSGLIKFYQDNAELCTIKQECFEQEVSDANPNSADLIQQSYTNIEIFYERLIAYAKEHIFPDAFYKDNMFDEENESEK